MKKVLASLGLTENEINLYMVLLRNGSLTASTIAAKTDLNRSYIYEALERLIDKGFAGFSLKDGKKYFNASDPENVLEIARSHYESVQKIMPNLKKLKGRVSGKPRVEIYSGRHAYAVMLRRLASQENITNYLIGVDENLFLKAEPVYMRQYVNNLSRKNIKEKVIAVPGSYKFEHPNIEYREMKEKFIGHTPELLSGDEIALFLPGPEHTLVLIKDASLAKAHKQRFDFFWKHAKKVA
jgi:sugar-specific transcriptional regulator TrmB